MVALSPPAYDEHSVFQYERAEFERLIVHEMVHIFEEYLSPNIEESPLIWSEGLAVYLSEQWRYEPDFNVNVKRTFESKSLPKLSKIVSGHENAYHWGWTVVMAIEARYGRELINHIVRNYSDGDIFSFVEDSFADFEHFWRGFCFGDLLAKLS